MFGSEKNATSKQRLLPNGNRDGGVTILTAGCHFSGKLFCKGATRIGGFIEGEVIAEGLLIVEEDAVINASVKAEEIVVHGRVQGEITVQTKIEMCQTSNVEAKLTTPNLVVHEGAIYNGQTTMVKKTTETKKGDNSHATIRELKGKKLDKALNESKTDNTTGVAARSPDISFA